MNVTEVIVQGTLNSDGTLQLDEKPTLPPGRVTVMLRQEIDVEVPTGDPFWQRMQAIWDAQKTAGVIPRSAEDIDAEQRRERREWEAHQLAIERLQDESRMDQQAQEPKL